MADLGDLINAGTSPVNVADANLTNQQAVGAGLQNQGTQLQLDYRRQFLQQLAQQQQNGTDSGVGAPGPSDNDFALNGQAARAYLQRKYQPIPDVYTNQELMQRQAAMASGVQGAVEQVDMMHKARIGNANNLRAQAATKEYSDLYGIATTDKDTPGSALEALRVSEPDMAAYFERNGWTDDETIRQHAADLAGLTHTTAQLPVEFKEDGYARDQRTGQLIPGYDNAVGMKPKERADLLSTYSQQVETQDSLGRPSKMPLYEKLGYKSADDAVRHATAVAQQHGVPGSAVPGVVSAAVANRQQAPAQAPGQAPAARPMAPQRPAAAAAAAMPGSPQAVRSVLATVPPNQRAAYTDPDFRAQALPTGPPVANLGPSQLQTETTKKYVADRGELNNDMKALSDTSSQALQYIQAAQAVLATEGKSPPTGLAAGVHALIARAAQAAGITDGDYATRYQELAKNLGQVAVQNFKSNFGARPAAKEFDIQMEQLNPNPHMTDDAVRNLLAMNARNAQYGIATAQRSVKYLAAGLEPSQFGTWNQKYNPREQAVNPPPLPAYNKQGWELHTDARGRQAYISPDGKQHVKVGP